MDFGHREIAQKRRVLYDQRQIIDELKAQMREVDEEIGLRDQRIGELEDMVRAKDGEMQDLVDMINKKDSIIAQMHRDIGQLEDDYQRRAREMEEKRRQQHIEEAKPVA